MLSIWTCLKFCCLVTITCDKEADRVDQRSDSGSEQSDLDLKCLQTQVNSVPAL